MEITQANTTYALTIVTTPDLLYLSNLNHNYCVQLEEEILHGDPD